MKRRAGNIDYVLIQAKRNSIRLSVNESGDVRVYAPKAMRLRDIDTFVASRSADVQAMEDRLRQRREAFEAGQPLENGARLLVLGRPVTLQVKQAAAKRARLEGDWLNIAAPDTERAALRALVRKVLSEEALKEIRRLIAIHAPELGVQPGRIAIREQKSRWGSCSDRHNLNFNWKLMLAPPEALEYVVIHELCHRRHMDHSAAFWRMVAGYCPDYIVHKRWLKIHNTLMQEIRTI